MYCLCVDPDVVPDDTNGKPSSSGMQGQLYLKHSAKKWLPYHFVLDGDSLLYYKDEKVSRPSGECAAISSD